MSTRTKPPVIRCQCGRLHRSWNPHKQCLACVRDKKSKAAAAVNELVRELERRILRPTPAEAAEDRELREAIHARWLARQPKDHPWKTVAARGGEA